MQIEDEYRKNPMMGFPNYPMMYDKNRMPGFEMGGGPMMPMPGMQRGFPSPFPMPYPSMMRPPMYPPGLMPPLPNQMDPMMNKMGGRMGGKPFIDPKAAIPAGKKEKEKSVKKEEESGKVLEFPPVAVNAEIFKSLHLSVKSLQEPLFLFTCKKILNDLESKLRDKKLKSRAKEIAEFVSNLYDKLKEAEKKDKKKGTSSTSEPAKISELELVSALNEIQDLQTFLELVPLEKFSLENCFESEKICTRESDESAALFEEARALLESSQDVTV